MSATETPTPPTYKEPQMAYVIRWLAYSSDPEKCYLAVDKKYRVGAATRAEARRFASREEARNFINTRVMRGRCVSKQSWPSYCSIEEVV